MNKQLKENTLAVLNPLLWNIIIEWGFPVIHIGPSFYDKWRSVFYFKKDLRIENIIETYKGIKNK